MDKKTIAIISVGIVLLLSVGINIYSKIRLDSASKQLFSAREDNQRLTDSNARAIQRTTELQAILDQERNIITELEARLSEQELVIIRLNTRVDRLTANFEESIPIFTETREIFEKYNSP